MGLRKIIKKTFYNLKFNKKNFYKLSNKTVLVTGASSGIGLGICKKLLETNTVIAIYNNNEKNLKKINNKNLIYVKCDLSNFNNFIELEDIIKKNEINIIINCAGQFGSDQQAIKNINFENFINIIKINSLSILKILQIIDSNKKLKFLEKVLNISSDGGSIELNDQGNAYIYRTSKSALNSISKNLSIDLNKNYGISVLTLDPGNVKTNMNGKGYLDANKCAEYVIDILCKQENYNGVFMNTLKNKIPW